MPTSSDPALRVLLALRLSSFAPTDVVAEAAGVDATEAQDLLERFRDKEWVRHRDGAISGWMLLATGRAEGERLLAEELDEVGGRAAVTEGYRRFLERNPTCLQLCTDWQLIERDGAQVVNEHDDPVHDAQVIARLHDLEAGIQPIVADLAAVLDRFAGYGPRFAAAVERVDAGELDWFTKPTIDSFHTVWFELHENLLATLGIERGTEEEPS